MSSSIARSLARFAAAMLLVSLFLLPAAPAQPIAAQQAAGSTNSLSSPPAATPVPNLQSASASNGKPSLQADARADFGHLPLAFEANVGQDKAPVRFKTRGMGGTLFFARDEVVLALPMGKTKDEKTDNEKVHDHKKPKAPRPHAVVRIRFNGASRSASVVGVDRLPGTVNYLVGKQANKWRISIPTYAGIVYQQLYPGIDLGYDGAEGQVKGTYTVAPGVDPYRITWRYDGTTDVQLDGAGNLVVTLPTTSTTVAPPTFTELAPQAWQIIEGRKVPVSAEYVVGDDGSVGFALGRYNRAQPLIIDPTMVYSGYVGGTDYEEATGIAVDSSGNAYITGYTESVDFPSNPGDVQPACDDSACVDAFVTKLSADGSAVVYSTFLGGLDEDYGWSIAVDGAGNASITGETWSPDFPTPATAGAYDRSCGTNGNCDSGLYSSHDAFVASLNADGTGLRYSSYVGGNSPETGLGVAVDSAGHLYVVGETSSDDLPTKHPRQADQAGYTDAFVAKIDPTTTGDASLIYSTYLGGGHYDEGDSIAVDSAGNAYVTGVTDSLDFPHTPGAKQPECSSATCDDSDAFVTKLVWNNTTHTLDYGYSTFLGGSEDGEWGRGIAVDSAGNAYVTGITSSDNFPTYNALEPTFGDGLHTSDAFVTKLNPTGSAFIYSTYLGGSSPEYGRGIAVDDVGNASVTGYTESIDFITTPNALQPALAGDYADAFVTTISPDGQTRLYSSYLGGSEDIDLGYGIAVDHSANLYVTGMTAANNFPTQPPQTRSDGFDAFVTKLSAPAAAPLTLSITDAQGNPVTALATNADGWPVLNAATSAVANPITVTVTVHKSSDTATSAVVTFGSSNNVARFYPKVHEQPSNCSTSEALPPDTTTTFSYQHFGVACDLRLLSTGAIRTFSWQVWLQPSLASILDFSAQLLSEDGLSVVDSKQSSIQIPKGNIRPVVFVPGFLGSYPDHHGGTDVVVDPIAGTYDGLITELQVLGYELDRSLILAPYKWYGEIKGTSEDDKNDMPAVARKLKKQISEW